MKKLLIFFACFIELSTLPDHDNSFDSELIAIVDHQRSKDHYKPYTSSKTASYQMGESKSLPMSKDRSHMEYVVELDTRTSSCIYQETIVIKGGVIWLDGNTLHGPLPLQSNILDYTDYPRKIGDTDRWQNQTARKLPVAWHIMGSSSRMFGVFPRCLFKKNKIKSRWIFNENIWVESDDLQSDGFTRECRTIRFKQYDAQRGNNWLLWRSAYSATAYETWTQTRTRLSAFVEKVITQRTEYHEDVYEVKRYVQPWGCAVFAVAVYGIARLYSWIYNT